MTRMGLIGCAMLGGLVVFACAGSPQPIPIYESPALTVNLMYDPRAGAGHSHPVTVSPERIAVILRGLQLQGRDVLGSMGLFADDQGTPAFSERDVAALTPHLSTGLAKASPQDVVTFHYVQRDSQRAPLVTSGGLFVRGTHLYVILANARTSPSTIQYETTYEPNSRINPLLPITRFKFSAGFTPAAERISTAQAKQADEWDGYLDESKVVVVDLNGTARRTAPR